jgi:Uma2 family endonuclease
MSSHDEPHAVSDLPPIDERLVTPETPYEVIDGELVYVPPADPPHGMRQAKLAALVEAHAADDFLVAVEMLTRTSKTNDFAPDVSVFPLAKDPVTGRRQLEHLAFEVVSTQSLKRAGDKAAKLRARGVRRVFGIDVERGRALEWSTVLGTWSVLDSGGHIADPAFAVPLPIAALLNEARATDVMAHALIDQRNPVIEAVRAQERDEGVLRGRQEGLADGLLRGKAAALLATLAARGLSLQPSERDRILDERDGARLDRWIARSATCHSAGEVLQDDPTSPDSSNRTR